MRVFKSQACLAVLLISLTTGCPNTPTPRPVSSPTVTGSHTEVITHTAQADDTLFSIAAKFHLQPEVVLWANEDVLHDNPHLIRPGVVLTILPINGLLYRWQWGDDLARVAERFNAKVDDIVKWPGNHLDSKDQSIPPGTLLLIPGGTRPVINTTEIPVPTP